MKQHLENLPDELLAEPRFFPVNSDKTPKIAGWTKPENQKPAAQVEGLKGFDTCGRGQRPDFLFLDFDHVLDDNGEFVTAQGRDLYAILHLAQGQHYCERSISGHGLHILALPTAGKFKPINAGREGTIDFGDGAKLEIFYGGKGRYCLLTGDLFNCEPKAPILKGEDADQLLAYIAEEYLRDFLLAPEPAPDDDRARTATLDDSDTHTTQKANDTPELDKLRAGLMLAAIDPAALPDSDWLAVMSACKNIGVPYADVDKWNARDQKRYNAGENQARWDSLNDSSFDMGTLHGVAKRFGYDERRARVQLYKQYPHLRPQSCLSAEQQRALFSGDASDLDNAGRIEFMFGDRIRYLTDADQWLTFDGHIWKRGAAQSLYPMVNQLAQDMFHAAHTKSAVAIAQRLKQARHVAAAISYLRGRQAILITQDDLDRHNNLLNCLNGVVDLETGAFYENVDPRLLITQQCAAAYLPSIGDDTAANFLRSILPDEATREVLLSFLGYALTGECNEEKVLFISGTGGNGKGTLTKTLLKLFADYGASLRTTAVLVAGRASDAGAATTELNPLENCRLAVVEELPEGGKLDAGKLKNISGGDFIPIRRLHQEQRRIEPHFSPILSGNYLPELSDPRDNGLLRRLLNIKFTRAFEGQDRDPYLKAKLSTPAALSGFLSLLVDAAQVWYRDGLPEPSEQMRQATEEYLDANDFLKTFIAEYFNQGVDLTVSRKDFIDKFKAEYSSEYYARYSGRREHLLIDAVKRIEGITYGRGGKNHACFFKGIGLQGTPTQGVLSLNSEPDAPPELKEGMSSADF